MEARLRDRERGTKKKGNETDTHTVIDKHGYTLTRANIHISMLRIDSRTLMLESVVSFPSSMDISISNFYLTHHYYWGSIILSS